MGVRKQSRPLEAKALADGGQSQRLSQCPFIEMRRRRGAFAFIHEMGVVQPGGAPKVTICRRHISRSSGERLLLGDHSDAPLALLPKLRDSGSTFRRDPTPNAATVHKLAVP